MMYFNAPWYVQIHCYQWAGLTEKKVTQPESDIQLQAKWLSYNRDKSAAKNVWISFHCGNTNIVEQWALLQCTRPTSNLRCINVCQYGKYYRVTRRVFSEPVISKLHLLCTKKILLVTLRHSRSLGFQLCIPMFHTHLCTVGQFVFAWQKNLKLPSGTNKSK